MDTWQQLRVVVIFEIVQSFVIFIIVLIFILFDPMSSRWPALLLLMILLLMILLSLILLWAQKKQTPARPRASLQCP